MQSVRLKDPASTLHALAGGIGDASCRPGFRGCAFINDAAEFSDPQDPVRIAVNTHRAWTFQHFASVAADGGVPDAASVGRQLMLLRDGAMVSGFFGDPAAVVDSLGAAFASAVRLPAR